MALISIWARRDRKEAKEAGLKVAIAGICGDEPLAGDMSFLEVPLWRHRFEPFRRRAGARPLASPAGRRMS